MKKIFVAAHYNLNNGDRAVLEATIQMIQNCSSSSEIVVSAFEPQRLEDKRFKVVGWPIKKNLIIQKCYTLLWRLGGFKLIKYFLGLFIDRAYMCALQEADIVLISGGHHLTDILGANTCYQLAVNYIVPILKNKDVYLLPQSIGPVQDKKIRTDVKYILDNVKDIAYRDKSSEEFLQNLGIKTSYKYIPDVVYTIKPTKEMKKDLKSVGIALYCNYSGERREKLMPFVIGNLKQAIGELLSNGYKVNFIPMEIKNSAADDRVVAEKMMASIDDSYKSQIRIVEPEDENIISIVNLFSGNDVILAYKTHSVVFATVNIVPVIAIAYHPKSIEFMQSIDLQEFAVDDKDATSDKLLKMVGQALEKQEEIKEKERQGVSRNVELILAYFNAIINKR